ncbi:hypothetical protein Moror_14221 [Moniliophthora roreri MCA 2997]|uniref:Uncharacterized protein n=1 Tax=Moniliophthora roreri (strain MCA 2997) TaxID=1381753 RepID=V2XPG1_MONRO|nr:hypothetical protein Moror_14221 [Moniliophthora roreri MCA 2997]
MQSFLEPEKNLPRFELDVRLDYIKYCIPDWICERGYPGMEVLAVGPYAPGRNGITRSIALDFEVDWKQNLWFDGVQYQGLEGSEMLVDNGVPHKGQARLRGMYEQIGNLKEKDKPGQYKIGRQENPVSHAPD